MLQGTRQTELLRLRTHADWWESVVPTGLLLNQAGRQDLAKALRDSISQHGAQYGKSALQPAGQTLVQPLRALTDLFSRMHISCRLWRREWQQ